MTLTLKLADDKTDSSSEAIAMMVIANASQEHLSWANSLIIRAKELGVDVSLEAGLLSQGGAKYPTLAIMKQGKPFMYAPCTVNDFFAKTADPGDDYTSGPKVEIGR